MSSSAASSMSDQIKNQVNEISMLLIMSSEQDEIGIDMLCGMYDTLVSLAGSEAASKRICEGWRWLKQKRGTVSSKEFFSLLQQLTNASTALCEGVDGTSFPNEGQVPAANGQETPSSNANASFIPEFIETHRMQLDDYEAWLLDSQFKSADGEDVNALVKRYLHSLKGDAGSVGLSDLEKTVHCIEDIVGQSSPIALAVPLLLVSEWVRAYLEALIRNAAPEESAQDFLKRFKSASEACFAPSAPIAAPVPETKSAPEGKTPDHLAGSSYTLTGETDIFQEFAAEAQEHLTNVESVVLESEGNYSKDSIDTIFRGIHSLKGGSAYFTFVEMTETSHLLENLLDEVRAGKRELDPTLTGLVLSYIDLQKTLLASAKKALAGDGSIVRCQQSVDYLAELHAYTKGEAAPAKEITPPAASQAPVTSPEAPAASVNPKASEPKMSEKKEGKSDNLEVKNFVKVDTARLDHLIDSIGEMVIYSSMLIRRCRELLPQHEDVQSVSQRVEKFTRDLQDVGMSMRLVPIKGLFQKMSRLVFDTSKKIKKDIIFSMDGEDTELDRNLIDKLADPLMHMVRNALDHGVEMPDERQASGKSRSGKVHLSASHSGGCVLIRIKDDGRGLNPEKLLSKAIEKGIVTPGQKLSEQETYQLIFAAGFSTAAVVTDISGRGVGMDVVRKNVESLRGRIHIDSALGEGTTFTIEIPLTLAIIDGIEVTLGKEHLVIPSLSIVEFVRPTKEMLNSTLDRGETFFFRGKYLPVFRLSELYNIEPRYENPLDATFIVVENHDELVALMVDEIVGELSTVIKSLGPVLGDVKGVSGCAVMPNGDVALILDVRSLVQLARKTYNGRDRAMRSAAIAASPA